MQPAESLNRRSYEDPQVVARYAAKSDLYPPERVIFSACEDELRGARVLDLGVGGGRTVAALSAPAGQYHGLDYSPALIDAALRRHPEADLQVGDARDLTRFERGSIDVVVFSFNGIDYIDHEGRLATLAQIHRVLREDGVFIFSTHNREHDRAGLAPWQGRRPGRTMLRQTRHALRHRRTRARMRALEAQTPEYALVNDDAHDYSLLTYYISRQAQVAQLHRAGFTTEEVYDLQGAPAAPGDGSTWLHYLARRAGAQ